MKDETDDIPADLIEERDVLGQPIRKVDPSEISLQKEFKNIPTQQLADFTERMFAAVIDIVICTAGIWILYSWLFSEILNRYVLLLDFLTMFIHIAYFAGLESSSWQATLGKRFMKIKVIHQSGERISFKRGVGRYLGKTISVLVLFMGVISIYTDKQRQGWHDMFANTLVIKDK